jgi:predicted GNAT superfamily acetyltransferase
MQNGMAKNNISYKTIEGIPEESTYKEIEKIYSKIFIDSDLEFFKQRIIEHPQLCTVLAYHNNYLVGFKIGYPYNETTFYSWIGGVLSKYRQLGIGAQLAQIQEDFTRNKGFKKLRTKSMNMYKAMMILNLKSGFDITNIYTNTKGQTKIVFEKLLMNTK